MPVPKVKSVEFSAPEDVSSGESELTVSFIGGGDSTFTVATFDRAEAWMEQARATVWWSAPVLFVDRLDPATVHAAVEAMAEEMGGYWLRYYHRRKR